jgi:hypothetical protein
MLVRTYRSATGREFRVYRRASDERRHDNSDFICTCKEYRTGFPWGHTCRHIRAFLAEQAKPNPFDSLDWL